MVLAAIRLAVLDEPESEEEVIFNQRPQPLQASWSLDTEETRPENTQHDNGSRRKRNISGTAQSNAAFSSPLVRWLFCQEEKEDIFVRVGWTYCFACLDIMKQSVQGHCKQQFLLISHVVSKVRQFTKGLLRGPQNHHHDWGVVGWWDDCFSVFCSVLMSRKLRVWWCLTSVRHKKYVTAKNLSVWSSSIRYDFLVSSQIWTMESPKWSKCQSTRPAIPKR